MAKHTTKQIMDRIKGMGAIPIQFVGLVKKEPVLVVAEGTRYWAILDKGVLTTPEAKINASDVINRNGTVYIIGGPISTEE